MICDGAQEPSDRLLVAPLVALLALVVGELLHRRLLFLKIAPVPQDKLVVVDLVPVELRAVHADELVLPGHGHPAGAAHAGAVDHYRVEAYHRKDVVGPGDVANRPHHGHGADADDAAYLHPLVYEVLEHLRDEPVVPVAPVVGRDVEVIARPPHLVLENQETFSPRAYYRYDLVTGGLERPGYGKDGRRAYAAA